MLKGFDQFLDQLTVIPPGEWDPNMRLEPPEKIPIKEERLERIAQINKIYESELKLPISEIEINEIGTELKFTGK